MQAYHNDPNLKISTLTKMQHHADADKIVRGSGYWSGKEGCAVGCLTADSSGGHDQYPILWGIPVELAYLEDEIFEGLSIDDAKWWPIEFLNAIQIGTDLSGVWPLFAYAILTDPDHGVIHLTQNDSKQKAAIENVAKLFQRTIDGEVVHTTNWHKASVDAYNASYTRGTSPCRARSRVALACAASAEVAERGGTARASRAAHAARLAARTANVGDEQRYYRWMRDTLLRLIKEVKA